MDIDVSFDFTTDSRGFWDGFWNRKGGLGYGTSDPDLESPTLRRYHSILWKRELPSGQFLDLQEWYGNDYIRWNDRRFGSDSITTGFRYERCRKLIEDVEDTFDDLEDYHQWMESVIRKTYTIGGSIIFPKHPQSMNQCRGSNPKIVDRWDLTLECIRRYYAGIDDPERNPLSSCMRTDSWFYDLFVDFKGYVDFFLLQDCVTKDYSEVRFFIDTEPFGFRPFPKDVGEYMTWIDYNLDFVSKRDARISDLSMHLL